MARDKMEYLESPYTAEEVQDYIDRGYKKWGKYYISPEEFTEREEQERLRQPLSGKGSLILLGMIGTAALIVTGVVKGAKRLSSWELKRD